MREKLVALKRLSTIYEIVEEMHSIEARKANAAVQEVQNAILAAEMLTYEGRTAAREALLMEDRAGRSVSGIYECIADLRKKKLEPALVHLEELKYLAQQRHLASRLWSERMKSVVHNASMRMTAEGERRSQAAEDDRFLARQVWRQRSLRNKKLER